jgi:hypothetical protein
MEAVTLDLIRQYVNGNIDEFHTNRLNRLKTLKLADLLKRKNPYLFKAKNINAAGDLVPSLLDAYLSSSEEGSFGGFLEGLAIYVAEIICGGQKSVGTGLDLDMTRDGIRYVIAVKSGPNWGNSDQYASLKANFKNAIRLLKQSKSMLPVQPVLGICYGSFKTVNNGEYLKIGGQSFWDFISGDPRLYIDIIEPIGYEAEAHNALYQEEKARTYNRFIRDFTVTYCDESGQIDWETLVRFNSGNLQQ